jgi:hypothetical protein
VLGLGHTREHDIRAVERLHSALLPGDARPRQRGDTRTRSRPGCCGRGDLVTCRANHSYKGLPLAVSVPVHRGNAPAESSAMPGLMAIRIRADGAVMASCFARDRMPLSKRGRTKDLRNWPPQSLRF